MANTAIAHAPSRQDVSDTSMVMAYGSTFTNTPYSNEVMTILREWDDLGQFSGNKHRMLVPYFEARSMATDRILRKEGFKQVLEIGPGLSLRGFRMAADGRVIYSEIDLPETMKIKRPLLDRLCTEFNAPKPKHLFLQAGDAFEVSSLDKAIAHFREEKIAIVLEGVLRMNSLEKVEKFFSNAHMILKHFGGSLITPDIEFLSELTEEQKASYKMGEQGEVNLLPNLFKDREHFAQVVRKMGFKKIYCPLVSSIDHLSSPARLGLSRSSVEDVLKKRSTYVFTCA